MVNNSVFATMLTQKPFYKKDKEEKKEKKEKKESIFQTCLGVF
jgi:hypothetical protein